MQLMAAVRWLTTDAAPVQDMFLQSHGIGAPTQTTAQLLVSCPLQHPGREAVFRALTAVPHLGPQVTQQQRTGLGMEA
jgi:hypothetical protein